MQLRSFLFIFFGAMITYVLIVISHESGHYTAARFMGYSHTRMHYRHTDTGANPVIEEYKTILRRNKLALKAGRPFAEEAKLMQLNATVNKMADTLAAHHYDRGKGSLLIYTGGPLATILIGTVGLLTLSYRQGKSRSAMQPAVWLWLIVLTALAWFKPVYELAGALIVQLAKGRADILTDEYKISSLLGVYPWTINTIGAFVGILLLKKTLTFVPPGQKRTLLLAGVTGIVAGYIFYSFIGPVLLP